MPSLVRTTVSVKIAPACQSSLGSNPDISQKYKMGEAFFTTGKIILYISGRDLFTMFTGSGKKEVSSLTRSFAWNSFQFMFLHETCGRGVIRRLSL
jgi:hypothetical protein